MIRRIWEALVVGAAGIVYVLIASDKDPDTLDGEHVESWVDTNPGRNHR